MFMTPPAVPLLLPAICIIMVQKGPSTQRTRAVAKASETAAITGLEVCAPAEIRIPEADIPNRGTSRRPHRLPAFPADKRSEIIPPRGIEIIDRIHGRLLIH